METTYWQANVEIADLDIDVEDDDRVGDLLDRLAPNGACLAFPPGRISATLTVTGASFGEAADAAVSVMSVALDGDGKAVRVEILTDAEAYGSG